MVVSIENTKSVIKRAIKNTSETLEYYVLFRLPVKF